MNELSEIKTNALKMQQSSELPALLSKKWLGSYYGISNRSGYTRSDVLFSKVLTDEVLRLAGLNPQDVRTKSKRRFTALETISIYKALQLI